VGLALEEAYCSCREIPPLPHLRAKLDGTSKHVKGLGEVSRRDGQNLMSSTASSHTHASRVCALVLPPRFGCRETMLRLSMVGF